MQRTFSVMILLLACGAANAALLSRSGGQAYYDDVLDITWLADANLANTNAFGVTGINASGMPGAMTWAKANEWIGAMNTAAYLGASDWRLPTVTDTGTPGCDWAYTGTDCGFNVNLSTGEMAHMFYSTLGNTGLFNSSGTQTGCAVGPNYCLTSIGPFSNLKHAAYWSGTASATNTSSAAWLFLFQEGHQHTSLTVNSYYAWAVRPGDIALVPVPGAVWFFGGALTLLGALRRRAMQVIE
jgi:hypothetical protein